MSLFEHYPQEIHEIEAQIRHYAAICGLEAGDQTALNAVIHDHTASGARETLRALLILKLKVEASMMDAGISG